MDANILGILNLMSSIINDEEDSSDYVITKYILTNLKTIQLITINDIIENVHVSRSSVRRYAKRLGYDNFSDFKHSFNYIAFPSNIHLRDFYSFTEYQSILNNKINELMLELNTIVTKDIIESLSDDIEHSEFVSIVCANNTASTMDKFQQELMYAHKVVKVVSSNFENINQDNAVSKDQLIIVVSISGIFSHSISEHVNKSKAKKILLTANRDEVFHDSYDRIIYLSSKDINEDKLGLISKYSVTYFFDLLSQHYIYTNFQ